MFGHLASQLVAYKIVDLKKVFKTDREQIWGAASLWT